MRITMEKRKKIFILLIIFFTITLFQVGASLQENYYYAENEQDILEEGWIQTGEGKWENPSTGEYGYLNTSPSSFNIKEKWKEK